MNIKDLFTREYNTRLSNSNRGLSFLDPEVILSILTKITGEVCHFIEAPSIQKSYLKISANPTKEEEERFQGLYDEIIKKYNLTEGLPYLYSTKGEDYYDTEFHKLSKNSSLVERSDLLFGEELICLIYRPLNLGFPFMGTIFYTSKTIQTAKDIWIRYSEACYEVVKNHKEEVEKIYEIATVMVDSYGHYDSAIIPITPTVSLMSPEFMDNYNSDFPEDRIKGFLGMNRGGIMIFNGHPGCGKSTYIKSLVFKNPDVRFIIIPQYLLLNQEAFRNFLFKMSTSEAECICVVEDCEQLLIQRESNQANFSSVIGDILNYTDGIFGDLTRTKFIFTFNTDISNIDKAILRPGRLYLKYEFTPLKGKNLEKVANRLGVELSDKDKKDGVPLANLYLNSKTEDLLLGSRPKRRIGFTGLDCCVGKSIEERPRCR